MKKVKKRLEELTRLILESKDSSPEVCAKYAAELKMLRELISTWKAFGSVEDSDFMADEAEVREKRNAAGSWDE